MDLREMGMEVVDWFHPSLDTDRWQALVNTQMNLQFPQEGKFLTSCSMELVLVLAHTMWPHCSYPLFASLFSCRQAGSKVNHGKTESL